jgi:peptidoglycan hydrolase CwlO-like protein
MKNLFILVTLVSLLSCGQENTLKSKSGVDVDSLLEKNSETFTIVNNVNRKSDSTITNKVDNTVKKIGQLENEIKELKEENNALKSKLDNSNDAGRPFNIRTISDN